MFDRMVERLEAVERERAVMLSSISHDLRTPLAALRASVEAIRDGKIRLRGGGYRAYRATALAGIDPTSTSAEGYAFLTELVRRLTTAGAIIVERPIVFRDRTRGKSKMSGRIIVESMFLVTRWGVGDRLRRVTCRMRR